MYVTATDEVEVNASADEVWNVYGSLRMPEMVLDILSDVIDKYEVVQGDGGPGTVLDFKYRPGTTAFSHYKEKFTVIDNEKRIKVAEGVEGGYLDLGIDRYQLRFEIMEKQGEKESDSCITKATVEYETKDLKAAQNALETLQSNVFVMRGIGDRVISKSCRKYSSKL